MRTNWNDWDLGKEDLGLELVAPFDVAVSDKHKVRADFLVKNFGAKNGMLIVTSYELVQPYLKELEDVGYGFCVLERSEAGKKYDRNDFIDMLSDWSWTGSTGRGWRLGER